MEIFQFSMFGKKTVRICTSVRKSGVEPTVLLHLRKDLAQITRVCCLNRQQILSHWHDMCQNIQTPKKIPQKWSNSWIFCHLNGLPKKGAVLNLRPGPTPWSRDRRSVAALRWGPSDRIIGLYNWLCLQLINWFIYWFYASIMNKQLLFALDLMILTSLIMSSAGTSSTWRQRRSFGWSTRLQWPPSQLRHPRNSVNDITLNKKM